MTLSRTTVGQAVRRAIESGYVPADATVVNIRKGGVEWYERGMRFRLWLTPSSGQASGPGLWTLYTMPAGRLGDAREDGGAGIFVPVVPIDEGSLEASWSDTDAFHTHLCEAREFVRDSNDLRWILVQVDDVVRGSLKASLYSSLGARMVGALLLCREAGDSEAEEKIRAMIRTGPQVEVAPGQFVSLRDNARRWAPPMTKNLNIKLDL